MDPARFLAAQDGVIDRALKELRQGAKVSHWMWFVFPQLTRLGRSSTARFYGLDGLADARSYLDHPVLGVRLRAAAEAMLAQPHGALEVLGEVDAMKLRSSATLFRAADPEGPTGRLMETVLDRFYGGQRCPMTEHAVQIEAHPDADSGP